MQESGLEVDVSLRSFGGFCVQGRAKITSHLVSRAPDYDILCVLQYILVDRAMYNL